MEPNTIIFSVVWVDLTLINILGLLTPFSESPVKSSIFRKVLVNDTKKVFVVYGVVILGMYLNLLCVIYLSSLKDELYLLILPLIFMYVSLSHILLCEGTGILREIIKMETRMKEIDQIESKIVKTGLYMILEKIT